MKALTVKQPFASLIERGWKTLEIRHWKTKYRGEILICSGKSLYTGELVAPKGQLQKCKEWAQRYPELYPLGVAICIANIARCRPMVLADKEKACIKYRPGLFAWELTNIQFIPQFPVRGTMGVFDVSFSMEEIKNEQECVNLAK